ncbi:uncharacterized protein LOC144159342 isoform X2 [Haemaphysalis longicornis]
MTTFFEGWPVIISLLLLLLLPASVASYEPDDGFSRTVRHLTVLEGEQTSLPCPIKMAQREAMAAVWFHVPVGGTLDNDGSPEQRNRSRAASKVYALTAPSPTSAAVGLPGSLVDGSHWKQPSWTGRAFFSLLSDPPALLLNRLERADGGSYFCDVTYRGENVTSGTIITEARIELFVAVPQSPPVITDSRGRVLNSTAGPYAEGDTIRLTCAVSSGNHHVTLAWHRDGGPLNSSSGTVKTSGKGWENTLEMGPLRREHLFWNISCLVTSNVSLPAESWVVIDVFLAPTSVSVWSWPYDEKEDSGWVMLAAATTRGTDYPLKDSATPSVQASQSASDQHSLGSPVFFSSSATNSIHDSTTGFRAPRSFECEVTGSRPHANVTWFLDGRPLDERLSDTRVQDNVTASVLLLPAPEQSGKLLECRATNANLPADRGGVRSSYLEVDLSNKPEVNLRLGAGLNASQITEGADVYMECSVLAASRVADVTWRHEGRVLRAAPADGVLVTPRYLVIRRVTPANTGRYTCRVTSADGESVESTPFQLRVRYPPRCVSDDDQVLPAETGVAVNVTCDVRADPSDGLLYFWLVQNDTDRPAGNKRDRRSSGRRTTRRPRVTDSNRLEIVPGASLFSGVLACWAENSVGMQIKRCRFKFTRESETSSGGLACIAANYTDTSFSLTCTAPPSDKQAITPPPGRWQRRLRVEVFDPGSRNRSERSFWTRDMSPVFITRLRPSTDYLVVVRMPPEATFRTYVRTLSPAQTLTGRGDFKKTSPQSLWTLILIVVTLVCFLAAVLATLLGIYLVRTFKKRRKRSRPRCGAAANAELTVEICDSKACVAAEKCPTRRLRV